MDKTQLYHSGVYDEKAVSNLLALGDPDFIRDLIAIFKENTPDYLHALNEYHQARNAWEMRQILHKMRGTCGTVGAKHLLAMVDALRQSLTNKDWVSATKYLRQLHETWSGTHPYLELMFDLGNE